MNIGDLTTDALYVGDEQAVAAYCGTDLVWTGGSNIDYSQEYLTFEIVSAGTLTFGASSTAITKVIQYSTDNGSTWTSWTGDTGFTAINVSAGDKVKVKGNNSQYASSDGKYTQFSGTSYFNVCGNIMSLLYGDNFTGQTSLTAYYTFNSLFNGSNIVSVENLIMPATTLTQYCYKRMFYGCTSLTSAPELPATTLKSGSYGYMFRSCSNLNYVKCLATDISASGCVQFWLFQCPATGTFVKAANMTSWPSGINGIPSGWTVQDAS